MKNYFKRINESFSFTDGVLMLIAFAISINMYKDEGGLAIFYGWLFATGILFAIKISLKDSVVLPLDDSEKNRNS